MPNIWDLVKYRSTIDDGTVYEHLTSDLGNPIVISGEISANLDTSPITVDIVSQTISADISLEIQANIDDSLLLAEIQIQPSTADVVNLI